MAKTTETKKAAEKDVEEVKGQENVEATNQTDLAVADEYGELSFDGMGFSDDDLAGLSGMDAVNPDDIRIPEAKLHSKISSGFELGDIELVDGTVIKGKEGEVLKGISILKLQPVRIYFPEKFNKNNTFICRSNDNIVGAPDGKFAGRKCADCEFSKFPQEGGASPCREQMLLLCTLPDGVVFHILVSGISVREFKNGFMSVEMMKGMRIVKRKIKRPILGAMNLNLSVEMEETDFGPFPKMVFKLDKDQPLVSPARLVDNLEQYAAYKEFEDEAVKLAGTYAQQQHDNEGDPEEATGQNGNMF